MSYLIDSDRLIDAITGVATALHLLDDLSSEGVAVSIVSLGELFEGAFGAPNPNENLEAIREFLAGYPILGLSEPIMEMFGRIRSRLRKQGQLIPDLDLLIASTALAHDLTLVTRNRRHFERVPNLRLYNPA